VSEVLASVLLKDPDLTSLPTDVPPSVRSLLTRCLVKESKDRFRDIGEARLAVWALVRPGPAPAGTTTCLPFVRPDGDAIGPTHGMPCRRTVGPSSMPPRGTVCGNYSSAHVTESLYAG